MEQCSQCGNYYKKIASHWQKSKSCTHPNLTKKQKEISIGVLMADGNVSKTGENASLRCILTEKEYLDYLGEEFGIITNRVSLYKSAKEKAKENKPKN